LKEEIIDNTRKQLMVCKEILTPLPPAFFTGAGLLFVSLAAKQIFFERPNDNNQLGWLDVITDAAWVIQHQREVNRFTKYCQCCKEMNNRGAAFDLILQQCSLIEPGTLIGPSVLFSEGLQKLYSWLFRG